MVILIIFCPIMTTVTLVKLSTLLAHPVNFTSPAWNSRAAYTHNHTVLVKTVHWIVLSLLPQILCSNFYVKTKFRYSIQCKSSDSFQKIVVLDWNCLIKCEIHLFSLNRIKYTVITDRNLQMWWLFCLGELIQQVVELSVIQRVPERM